MHAKKIVLLVAVVALLGFLVSRQLPNDDPAGALGIESLLPGIDRPAVDFVRFEDTRSQRLIEFARDDDDAWRMVHPIEAPADDDVLGELLARVVTSPGRPAVGVTRESAGLDPPAAILELVEGHGGDAPSRHVIEFGALDLDESNVYVFAGGRILRASRGLWDVLQRPSKDFRRARILPGLEPRDVIAITRRGLLHTNAAEDRLADVPPRVYTSNPGGDILLQDLAAESVDDEWLATEPFRTRLDPAATSLFVNVLVDTRARNFFDGRDADPVVNGFEEPLLVFELKSRDGSLRTIELATPVTDLAGKPMRTWTWVARVDGDDSVHYVIDGSRARALTQPFENLLQFQLLRVLRKDMTRVVASGPDGSVAVERVDGGWFVVMPDGSRRRADAGLVADWIGDLDRLEYVNVLDPSATQDFAVVGRIEVATEYGEHLLELGPLVEIGGIEARSVRRAGEQVWGFVARDLLALSAVAPRSLLDLRLLDAQELAVASVGVERASDGAAARWVRERRSGLWSPAGAAGLEDRDFALLVDRVLAPVALEWLESVPAAAADPNAGLAVTVNRIDGSSATYRLVDVEDRIVAVWDGLAAHLASRTLHDGLEARLDALR